MDIIIICLIMIIIIFFPLNYGFFNFFFDIFRHLYYAFKTIETAVINAIQINNEIKSV